MNESTTLSLYAQTVIAAYQMILTDISELLPDYPTEQMRTYVTHGIVNDAIPVLHNWYSPLLYVSLHVTAEYAEIAFARNHEIWWRVSPFLETALARSIYRRTMKEYTPVNIEGCLEEYVYVWDDHDKVYALVEQGDSEYSKYTVSFRESTG